MQLLLLADPQPIVDRLGRDFFRSAPQGPGVYLMRDAANNVVYVGKAKNLRKRLACYRVANPERLRRRHLKLLHSVVKIELEECQDEATALTRESELLLALRPRYNRAGTWQGPPKFLGWRLTESGIDLAIFAKPEPEWHSHGPLGSAVIWLRATLIRLLWCALYPQAGIGKMPQGWFRGSMVAEVRLPRPASAHDDFVEAQSRLSALFAGRTSEFIDWIRQCTTTRSHPFELSVLEADLETVSKIRRLKSEA